MQNLISQIKEKVTGQNNLIAIALNDAINNNQDGKEMFSNIKDMANDNYRIMRDILGKPLLTDILNYRF